MNNIINPEFYGIPLIEFNNELVHKRADQAADTIITKLYELLDELERMVGKPTNREQRRKFDKMYDNIIKEKLF